MMPQSKRVKKVILIIFIFLFIIAGFYGLNLLNTRGLKASKTTPSRLEVQQKERLEIQTNHHSSHYTYKDDTYRLPTSKITYDNGFGYPRGHKAVYKYFTVTFTNTSQKNIQPVKIWQAHFKIYPNSAASGSPLKITYAFKNVVDHGHNSSTNQVATHLSLAPKKTVKITFYYHVKNIKVTKRYFTLHFVDSKNRLVTFERIWSASYGIGKSSK